MKKAFAMLAVLILIGCVGAPALGEAPRALNWAAYEKEIDEDGIPAAFYSLGDTGMMIWVPVPLDEAELTEADSPAPGEETIAAFVTEDGTASVSVSRLEGDAETTLEEMRKNLPGAGSTSAETVTVNGLEAMRFAYEPEDAQYLIVAYGPGMYLQFVFRPVSDESFFALVPMMEASIQAENMSALVQQGRVNDRFLEKTISWEDVAESAAEVDPDAEYAQIGEMNFQIWLPSVFAQYELTQEQSDAGIIALLGTPDGSGIISISESPETADAPEDWRDALIRAGFEDAEITAINGIRAVVYSDGESDSLNVLYCVEDGGAIQFSFAPMSNKGYAAVAAIMISSLQEIE